MNDIESFKDAAYNYVHSKKRIREIQLSQAELHAETSRLQVELESESERLREFVDRNTPRRAAVIDESIVTIEFGDNTSSIYVFDSEGNWVR